jgi:Carboxypeptidase regulatory-like domain
MRNHATLILVLIACFLGASSALAEPSATPASVPDGAREGIASTGLCGLTNTAYPTCPQRWAVAANAGYHYTESVGAVDGAHHRMAGSLGAGVVPLPWLAVALRLDGRVDVHPHDDLGKDLTGTGDPRLFLRAGHDLARGASIGGEAVLWFPGTDAPSFKPRATTADFKALAAWRPRHMPLALLGHVGYRLDNSANSAPDLNRLRAGDRVALGLSDSDAVLVGIGASTRAVHQCELFVDLSLDYLLGDRAPEFRASPVRASLGARYFLKPGLQGELSATGSFSSRASLAANAPLVPVEPRVSISLGLRYGRALHAPPAPVERTPERPEQPVTPEPELPKTTDISGVLLDDKEAPIPDVRVVLTVGPETALRETVTDGDGRYGFTNVPIGDATLAASAPGFETQQWVVEVRPGVAITSPNRALARKGNTGTLRLLTRTFSSEPLSASIQLRDARSRKPISGKSDAQGTYEIDLQPGRYTVMISAPGYRTLRREVTVERYGVAILNVDMREAK